jgi:hypothetical protein
MQAKSTFSDFLRQFSLPDSFVLEEDYCEAGLNEVHLGGGTVGEKSQLDAAASSRRARPIACTQCSLAKRKCLNISETPPCDACLKRGLDCFIQPRVYFCLFQGCEQESGFASEAQRNEHIGIAHRRKKGRRKNVPCPVCKKIFSRSDSVLRHIERMHRSRESDNGHLSVNSPAFSDGILSESTSSHISMASTDTMPCISGSDM